MLPTLVLPANPPLLLRPRVAPQRRAGVTLAELLTVVTVASIVCAASFPRVSRLLDRIHVSGATTEIVSSLAVARHLAVMRGGRSSVRFDEARGWITVRVDRDTVRLRRLGDSHGVTIRASRDSLAYHPNGLGLGAANLSVIVRRGRAADTVFVSRLGRVRR